MIDLQPFRDLPRRLAEHGEVPQERVQEVPVAVRTCEVESPGDRDDPLARLDHLAEEHWVTRHRAAAPRRTRRRAAPDAGPPSTPGRPAARTAPRARLR